MQFPPIKKGGNQSGLPNVVNQGGNSNMGHNPTNGENYVKSIKKNPNNQGQAK
jgi:hypothetical protein